jgi:predicted DCC family thiol-disulfide oxidoreductase YuxK
MLCAYKSRYKIFQSERAYYLESQERNQNMVSSTINESGNVNTDLVGPIVLIDGECVLCDSVAQFIVNHEQDTVIRFATLQSTAAIGLLGETRLDSVVYIDGERILFRSDAALAISAHLQAPWSLLGILRFIPRILRDPVYRLVAKTRYRVFGRKELCSLPSSLDSSRILSD